MNMATVDPALDSSVLIVSKKKSLIGPINQSGSKRNLL